MASFLETLQRERVAVVIRGAQDAGAVAVGVGKSLVKKDWLRHGDWEALREAASEWAKLRRPD